MTAILVIAALWLTMAGVPDIPVSRLLRRLTVDAPARWCARIERGHLYLALTLAATIAAIGWFLEADGLAMFGMATPELMSWIVMFDVATWFDVAVTAAVLAGSVRLDAIRSVIASRRPTRRARRSRMRGAGRTAVNDDEDRRSLAA